MKRYWVRWTSVIGYLVHLGFILFWRESIAHTLGEQARLLALYEYSDTTLLFSAQGKFLPVTVYTPLCLYLPAILGILTIIVIVLNRLNDTKNDVAGLAQLVGISLGVLTILAVVLWLFIMVVQRNELDTIEQECRLCSIGAQSNLIQSGQPDSKYSWTKKRGLTPRWRRRCCAMKSRAVGKLP